MEEPDHFERLAAPETPFLKLGDKSGRLDASTSPLAGGYVYNWRAALASAPTVYVKTAQTTGARNTLSARPA